MQTKRIVNLEVKRKAAKAELTIRIRARNAAAKGLARIEAKIGVLNEKISKLEGAKQLPSTQD